ncbi:hypothetical protein DL93DRAFT_1163824 [Clavulina sp. PMI_390]|nr:hypothetical protein DL93DRAFT_1163824 [Clavulina sp. PMI_390]
MRPLFTLSMPGFPPCWPSFIWKLYCILRFLILATPACVTSQSTSLLDLSVCDCESGRNLAAAEVHIPTRLPRLAFYRTGIRLGAV